MGDIGIMGLRPPGGSWRDTLDLAERADGMGYSCITTGEAWGEDAFTSLAQIAAVTSRIRIGTSIVPIFATLAVEHSDDRGQHGPDVRGPVLPRTRRERAACDRGLPWREVQQAPDTNAGVHRHHPQGHRRPADRPRRRILQDPAVQAQVQDVPRSHTDLHRVTQSPEPETHRRAGRRLAAHLPRAVRAWTRR